jgi:hypothetical protein
VPDKSLSPGMAGTVVRSMPECLDKASGKVQEAYFVVQFDNGTAKRFAGPKAKDFVRI